MNDWFEAEQHVERAHEFFELSRWDEAESELREAIALNPFRAEWHFNLGLTLEAAGRRREAISAFESAHELEPGEFQTALLIGVNLLRSDDAGADDFKAAIRWLDEASRNSDTSSDATVHLIEAHARLGEHDQAEICFYLALQMPDADHALAYVNVSDSLIDRNEHARAASALREAIQIDPTMPGVYARLAGAYAALGKRDRARRLYMRELRCSPGDVDTLLDLGCLLAELNRTTEAAEKFRRVLEIENDNADAHFELGSLALREGRLDEARRAFRLVLRLDPSDHRALRKLADVHHRSGKLRDAQVILCEQARTLPDRAADFSVADREELGRLLLEVGLPTEASGILHGVVAEKKDDAALWRLLSVALLRSGQRAAGIRAARRERKLSEKNSIAAMHNIAMALLADGQLKRASVWLHYAIQEAPCDGQLRRLRRRLIAMRLAMGLKRA